ncbi:MAG: helix-turn-helix domain-containing protein, partial [Bacteroidota bacterium]
RTQPRANIFLAIYLLAFSLRIGKSLFHNYFVIDASLRTLFLTTLLCVGPAIWLYTIHFTQADQKTKPTEWLHFVPFVITAALSWLIPNNGSWIFGVFYNFLTAHMLLYILLAIWKMSRLDLKDVFAERPGAKKWLHYFLLTNLVFVIVYFLISELIIPFYIGISFLFSAVIVFFSFWGFRHPSLFKNPIKKYRQSRLSNQDSSQLMDRLAILMQQEKLYLDPSLTLATLSTTLGVSSKELSQAINQSSSLNYSQYISRHRVEEVKRRLQSPDHQHLTIAAVAYDSGFSSISTFNAAFKKHAGQTARAYRKSLSMK